MDLRAHRDGQWAVCDAQFPWLLGGQRVTVSRLRAVAQPHHRLP
jgi:hypothetical protein